MKRPFTRVWLGATAMLICAALASLPAAAQAEAAVLSAAWNWNPLIGAALAFVAWRYMDGVWSLWRRSGVNRGVARWQVTCFWLGLLALFAALISPLDGLSEQLFYAHMVQHLLLMLVAPPLLLLGLPPVALAWAMPGRWRRSLAQWWHRQTGLQALWRLITEPVSAWIIFAIVVWLWHLPGLYQAALRDPVVHALEHACFLGSALLFWWVLPLHGREHRMSYGAGVLYVFTTALHSSILGVLLTFSTSVWYADYAVTAPLWGVTPLEDQQLAGLIMWIPAGVFYLIAVLALLAAWLHAMERRSQWELEKPSLK